jgi:hypothetical protein
MHCRRKAEVTRPAAALFSAQHGSFYRFRQELTNRQHETLKGKLRQIALSIHSAMASRILALTCESLRPVRAGT